MNAVIFLSGLVTIILVYLAGRRDERVKWFGKITELRHACYKQQEVINALTIERDVFRSGYESMSKRVQRMDYKPSCNGKVDASATGDMSQGDVT
ncbi:MAG: hypothetical protein JSS89_12115 [Bacteroidetes bacterium]|nr:hypothetical protein [Bacteroidota bacterium]